MYDWDLELQWNKCAKFWSQTLEDRWQISSTESHGQIFQWSWRMTCWQCKHKFISKSKTPWASWNSQRCQHFKTRNGLCYSRILDFLLLVTSTPISRRHPTTFPCPWGGCGSQKSKPNGAQRVHKRSKVHKAFWGNLQTKSKQLLFLARTELQCNSSLSFGSWSKTARWWRMDYLHGPIDGMVKELGETGEYVLFFWQRDHQWAMWTAEHLLLFSCMWIATLKKEQVDLVGHLQLKAM